MMYSFEETINILKESEPLYSINNKSLRFIVDAQLPQKLAVFLKAHGFDSIHTLDLPDQNKTTDKYIAELACNENRVLITKDDDFLQSFLISGKPQKLILLKTGNISNNDLIEIFKMGITAITTLMQRHFLIEITQHEIIVHN